MDNFEPYQIWLLMAAVAWGAFIFGRATASKESSESRAERRMREEMAAEEAFSKMDGSKQAEVDRLIGDGKHIDAIRLIREETGLGLKDAKQAADRRRAQLKGAA